MRLVRVLALVTAAVAPGAPAEDGNARFADQRLFTTAAQREHLDALRAGTEPPRRAAESRHPTVAPPPEKKVPKKQPPSVALQGFIRRSDGSAAVWANGENTLTDEQLARDVRVDSGQIDGRSVTVTLPDGRTVHLEPGQIWDSDRGRVVESYRR